MSAENNTFNRRRSVSMASASPAMPSMWSVRRSYLLKNIVVKCAKALWRWKFPDRARLPEGFEGGFPRNSTGWTRVDRCAFTACGSF